MIPPHIHIHTSWLLEDCPCYARAVLKTKKGFNSLEWQNLCQVYSVPKKNTGIVHNGEIVANRNQSEEWANEDNFLHSFSFKPIHWNTLEDGNVYVR